MPEDPPKKIRWESLQKSVTDVPSAYRHYSVQRAKVYGGWLVRSFSSYRDENSSGIGVGLTFIPDPEWKWIVDTLE